MAFFQRRDLIAPKGTLGTWAYCAPMSYHLDSESFICAFQQQMNRTYNDCVFLCLLFRVSFSSHLLRQEHHNQRLCG